MTAAALSFSVALAVALVGTPFVRRLALASEVVDHPAERKLHREPVPYLGGIPIIVGAVVGGLVVPGGVNGRFGVAALAAITVGILGLVDDVKDVAYHYRLAIEAVAAVAVASAGVRLHVSGVEAIDIGLTVVWIVGITNAVNFLDNMDGLAGGVAAAAAAGIFVLAAAENQDVVALIAVAIAGACLGFLRYNRRPAKIFMGDAGSLFLGFLLAVAALEVDPARQPPASFAAPLLLLALPVLDTTVVTLARLRHGRSPTSGGKDHLSHRLVVRGLPPGLAVGVLIAVEVVLAALAVLAGRNIIALPQALGGAALLLTSLAAVVIPAKVYPEPAVGFSRTLKGAALVAVVAPVVFALPTAVAMVTALGPARAGRNDANQAVAAVNNGDYTTAADLFERSQRRFAQASRRLNWSIASSGLSVPVVSSNLRAARLMVELGEDLASSGHRLTSSVEGENLTLTDGRVPLEAIRRVTPELNRAAATLRRASARIGTSSYPYLVPPLRTAGSELENRIDDFAMTTTNAAEAARLVPEIAGASGTRRYFLAVENTAELRASGGFIGSFGELVAKDGRITLERFGRLADLRDGGTPIRDRTLDAPKDFLERFNDRLFEIKSWAHVNITPDFPTTARLIASLYPQSTGQPIDGVIGVDPIGLAAVLKLTGPVSVASWPVPLTSENIVKVTTQEQYERFGELDARPEFLGDVAQAVWQHALSGQLGRPERMTQALSPATRARHLKIYLNHPREAAFTRRLGIAGAVPPVQGDSLLFVTHNGGGNKVDAFASRDIRYRVRVEPQRDGTAKIGAVLDATLTNRAPSSGLPLEVLGGPDQAIKPGESYSLMSVYTPLQATAEVIEDKRVPFRTDDELGRLVHWNYLRLPSGDSVRMQMALAGRIPLAPGDWYVLDLLQQPTLRADKVRVEIEVPSGWRIADAPGLQRFSDTEVVGTFTSGEPQKVMVHLRRRGLQELWSDVTD